MGLTLDSVIYIYCFEYNVYRNDTTIPISTGLIGLKILFYLALNSPFNFYSITIKFCS
jgi:hypothetical protein